MGVHSPHGQTNFLPPKTKIRVIWLENKLSIVRESDLQHLWTYVFSPFPFALRKATVLMISIFYLCMGRICIFGKLTSLVTYYGSTSIHLHISSEEYWFPKPMSIFINKLIYLWRMAMNLRSQRPKIFLFTTSPMYQSSST